MNDPLCFSSEGQLSDFDAFCFLRTHLEPFYRVIARPGTSYFSQWHYCYQILHDGQIVAQLEGDLRTDRGSLARQAQQLVTQLAVKPDDSTDSHAQTPVSGWSGELPIASRLPPKRSGRTWFGSGRAAFAWLIQHVVKPRRIYLPTFICWSLVDVMQTRFPDTELRFYSVDASLHCSYPADATEDDAVVYIHYFGHRNTCPQNGLLLEDTSHQLMQHAESGSTKPHFRFGSLRKAYRTADGGYLAGRFNPVYETTMAPDAWLRLAARDWTDLREAENMTDRRWHIRDISSQSLAVVLSSDDAAVTIRRRRNHDQLNQELQCGRSLVAFRKDECPLLHCRLFDSEAERDSLRTYLASCGVFTSIHWPVHDVVRAQADAICLAGADRMARCSLAFPVNEGLQPHQLDQICECVRQWWRAGAA